MITCKECGKDFNAKIALSYHLREHGIKYVDYVVKHDYEGKWPTCTCGKKLVRKNAGFPRFCSKSCASSGENNAMHGKTGENSPIFGIKRTEEQRKNYVEGAKKRWEVHGDKMREIMKTPEYREAQSKANRCSYDNTDKAQKISKGIRRFWSESPLAATLRAEASARAIRLLAENKIGPQAPFKTEWKHNPFTGKAEFMHSSWETVFLDTCIARKYPVTKEHGIEIQYNHPDGTQRIYVPDFYASEDRTLYEVKGRHDVVDEAKWSAAREWCNNKGMNFQCIFESDLEAAP